MVIELDKKEFEQKVLKKEGIVLVDFYANWCGPCRMLAPIMEEISKTTTVYKIDVDKQLELATSFGIMSIPCIIAFKDGKEIARTVGLKDKDEILQMIK